MSPSSPATASGAGATGSLNDNDTALEISHATIHTRRRTFLLPLEHWLRAVLSSVPRRSVTTTGMREFFTRAIEAGAVSEPISTGCDAIDDLLDGGFERGAVSQLYGPPAAGKTNVALSAAVEIAADSGSALYIDTEGLSLDRFEQVAAARAEQSDESLEDVVSRVIVTDAVDFEEQEKAVRDAADFASQVDLVVLDSATGFYRLERDDDEGGETLRKVARQLTHLLSLARKEDLAVVITNQVFADIESETDRPRPLGGHTLNHWSGVIVRIERFRGGNRRATLEKHRSKAAGETARFRITATGIESVDDP